MAEEAIVSFTLERIADLLVREAILLSGVKTQVESLQSELTWMQSYLKDMDAKSKQEEGDNERFQTCTREIRRIAYDAEDIIDSFIVEASLRRRRNPLDRYFRVFSSCFRTHQFGTEIEAIKVRVKENTERLKRYGVKSSAIGVEGSSKTTHRVVSRMITYSHVEDDDIVGLDEEIKHLVDQLVLGICKTWVVSVVGMGGLGKTTLARQVYNHALVKQHFKCRAWVSISQAWDRRDVLGDISRQILGGNHDGHSSTDQELLENLYAYLKSKVYLIVLDDTWKLEAREDVFPALPHSQGSKIFITTRNASVPVQADPSCIIHEPCLLNNAKSWELFANKASFDENTSSEFVTLAKEMVNRCNGLPLAISALGGLLRTKKGLDEWERTCKALTSNIMKQKGSPLYGRVDEMLALSYYDLPYDLKPCFLYMGLFPEHLGIKTGMLIRMWIAEGFINSEQLSGEETLEDVGRKHLDELIGPCLIQVAQRSHSGKVVSCRIHDLIRDVCLRKAREQDFLEIHSSVSPFTDLTTGAHRTAIHYGNSFPEQNSHLRSLLHIGKPASKRGPYRELNLESLCQNFRLLRVLNLWGFRTHSKALPKQIGSLVHLRYLGLRLTNISIFPDSMGNLHNLLTLDCRRIKDSTSDSVRVPNVLWKMKNLRQVYLPWGSLSSMDSLGISTMGFPVFNG